MSTNLPEQPQKQNILVKTKEDMNPGFDPGQPYHDPEALLAPHRRHRRAVIESDPEDDIEVQKYSATQTETSTPSYSMDTDISTLEAPTFTTLSQGPSQINSLIWDHPVNLIGKKVVNPILHMCDKCVKPILIYGRLGCKHVLCLSCATALKNTEGQCTRCSSRVSQVEQASFGQIWMCSHGGSRYGQDGCQRTYLSERDLKAHVNFRHLKNQPKKVPSAEEIAAATAALMAVDRKMRVPPPATAATVPPAGASAPVSTGLPNFSQPPPVINRTPTNLITVPIQDNNTSGSTATSGSTGAGPAASDYWTTNKFNQPPPSYYQRPPPNHYQSSQQSSYEWTGSRTGSSGYHRR